ncbi:GAF domain-containing protein [Planococcus glaciei]|uniref:GAF domain-containing protein n=1 Tax=Planococcus glaciei TaxID=459472 RepID=A0A7H8QET8_9BACL|nr:GAF domain-containing protein [Planococcus glaciei]ETP68166.1 hypothetical protein G159_14000 [Planococcus glaciei CHR43]QDY46456.1 GAF domain-containing protein [Planococcus glaciei]QKX52042.1 GAF domain-containing protein [Planococcus glaciei]
MTKLADYQPLIEQIRTAGAYDLVAIALVEPAENQYLLKWKYASGNLNDRFKKVILQTGKGIAGMVFKTGKPLLLEDTSDLADSANLFNYPILIFERLKSMGAVPLWHNGRVAGVLLAGYRGSSQMTEEKLHYLKQQASKGIGELNGKELMLH